MKQATATYASGIIAVSNFAHVSSNTADSITSLCKNMVIARTYSEFAIMYIRRCLQCITADHSDIFL